MKSKISTFVERWVLNADGPAAVESNLNTQGVIVVPARPVRSHDPSWDTMTPAKAWEFGTSWTCGESMVAVLQSITEKGQAN
jgi:hypothetical protein